jgi:hypothetical protein
MKTLVLFHETIAIIPAHYFCLQLCQSLSSPFPMEAESSSAHIEQQEWQIYSFPPPKNIGK